MKLRAVFLSLLLSFIFSTFSWGGSQMVNNLQQVDFPQKAALTNDVLQLLKASTEKTDAYELSMVLLMSAILGHQDFYNQASDNMQSAMKNDRFPSWASDNIPGMKAWMQGRMFVAANMMGDTRQADKMNEELEGFLKNRPAESNELIAWAWAYWASGLEGIKYSKAKDRMLADADALTNLHAKFKTADVKKEPAARSNALWAWVMNLFAAAHANDKATYDIALNNIKRLVKADNDKPEMFIQKLFEQFPASDYRAWGLANMRVAASMMRDTELLNALEVPVKKAIQDSKIEQDKILATLNNQFSETCCHKKPRAKI